MSKLRHPVVMLSALMGLAVVAAWDNGLITLPLMTGSNEEAGSPGSPPGTSMPNGKHRSAGLAWRTGVNRPGERDQHPLTHLDKNRLKEILERPLFSASRRPPPRALSGQKAAPPPPPPAAPPPSPKAPPSNFRLLGILAGGEQNVAIIHNAQAGKTLSLRPGGLIGEWRVLSIEAKRVKLKHKSWTVTLSLFSKK